MKDRVGMHVIFENHELLIIDKPAMMLSVPSRMGSDEKRPCALTLLTQENEQKIFAVHRLDYEVSGLLCFAKNAHAHRILNGLFESRQIEKEYEALTSVSPQYHEGEKFDWQQRIHRGKKRSFESEYGKDAVTRAEILKSMSLKKMGAVFYWRLMPLTGRSHQLRVALASHGLPIAGDALYGSGLTFDLPGIALRALSLKFKKNTELELPTVVQAPSFLEGLT